MIRSTICAAAVVIGVFSIWSAGDASPNPGVGSAAGDPLLQQEPVLVYNYRALTFSGTFHTQLTVYNSGFATIARVDELFFPPSEDLDVQVNSVTATGASQLLRSLAAAGAFLLTDPTSTIQDAGIHTVTVFSGTTDARAHTFSYYGGVGEYAAVDNVISTFIASTFPEF